MVSTQGDILDDPAAIEGEILGYYQNLLGSPFSQRRDACETLAAAIQKKVPMEFRDSIIGPVNEVEVLEALRSIHIDKAPRPDGFNSAFFQGNWNIVKEDFVAGILFFF